MAVLTLCLFGLEAARKAPIQRALVRSLEAFVFISFCVLPSVTALLKKQRGKSTWTGPGRL